nr:hypothetical protein [Caenispirillum bisanense]
MPQAIEVVLGDADENRQLKGVHLTLGDGVHLDAVKHEAFIPSLKPRRLAVEARKRVSNDDIVGVAVGLRLHPLVLWPHLAAP